LPKHVAFEFFSPSS